MPQTILGSYTGEWFTVQTPEQARLLSDSAAVQMLQPFLGRTLGAAEAAREAGVSVERLSYRIRQFVAAGLLKDVGEQPRRGRPVRLYQAAGGIFLPFQHTPFEDLEAQIAVQLEPIQRAKVQALARLLTEMHSDGRVLYRDEVSGKVHSEAASSLTPHAAWRGKGGNRTGKLWLSRAQLAELQALYDSLSEWVTALETGPRAGAKPYLLELTLVPLEE
ncbi:hypothetical protein GCM10017783_14820 [Deinococcus piscis]|uniref:HTH marR-type domain-containing protein n=1 Tax=Deinococcus piscis TaxID=394230 RepID=A0ABQ3KBJ2_9DEIO|nr:hypothetical protein [Deinococcus piscis]GHG03452.1 hypothetical protein GCM10017783_14820 [Deinococcus piscis]